MLINCFWFIAVSRSMNICDKGPYIIYGRGWEGAEIVREPLIFGGTKIRLKFFSGESLIFGGLEKNIRPIPQIMNRP